MYVFGFMKVGFVYFQIYCKDLVFLRVYVCKYLFWVDNVNVYDIC